MQLHAHPYDQAATGFYFTTADEYTAKVAALLNDYGDPVEEFEIQFIDGDEFEADLARVGLDQCNFAAFIAFIDEGYSDIVYAGAYALLDNQYRSAAEVFAMSEGDLREQIRHECSRDVWYEAAALKEYAEQYLDDTGDWESIPEHLRGYFDTEAYARDMGYNGAYAFEFAGKWWVSE